MILSLHENHQHLSNQEKSIPVVNNHSESNVNSEILINDSGSIATQIPKSINDRVQSASNVDDKHCKSRMTKKKIKIYVPLSLERKHHSNVLV